MRDLMPSVCLLPFGWLVRVPSWGAAVWLPRPGSFELAEVPGRHRPGHLKGACGATYRPPASFPGDDTIPVYVLSYIF